MSEDKFALGGLAALAIWTLVVLPLLYQGDNTNPLVRFWDWMTDEAISFFTAVLAVSTIGLWIVTWRGILGQSRDKRANSVPKLLADIGPPRYRLF